MRIAQEHTRNGDALLLPTRKAGAALAHKRVVAVFQASNKLVNVRLTRSPFNPFLGSGRVAIQDVLANRTLEQIHILLHDAHLRTKRLQRGIAHINAVDFHGTRRHIVEAR